MDTINFQEPTLYFALAHILFNPIFWNTAARAGNNTIHVKAGEKFRRN